MSRPNSEIREIKTARNSGLFFIERATEGFCTRLPRRIPLDKPPLHPLPYILTLPQGAAIMPKILIAALALAGLMALAAALTTTSNRPASPHTPAASPLHPP